MILTEQVESLLLMLKKHGYRPTSVEVAASFVKVEGLEPLPPDPSEIEDEEEASQLRSAAEESRQRLRDLGLR